MWGLNQLLNSERSLTHGWTTSHSEGRWERLIGWHVRPESLPRKGRWYRKVWRRWRLQTLWKGCKSVLGSEQNFVVLEASQRRLRVSLFSRRRRKDLSEISKERRSWISVRCHKKKLGWNVEVVCRSMTVYHLDVNTEQRTHLRTYTYVVIIVPRSRIWFTLYLHC